MIQHIYTQVNFYEKHNNVSVQSNDSTQRISYKFVRIFIVENEARKSLIYTRCVLCSANLIFIAHGNVTEHLLAFNDIRVRSNRHDSTCIPLSVCLRGVAYV